MRHHWSSNHILMLLTPFLIALLFIVACGGSATPTTAPVATSAPAPTDTPVPGDAATQPTAAPQPTTPPEVVVTAVHPGKVVVMIGGWGSERMDYTYDVGGSNNVIRFFGDFLIAIDEETQYIPGLATDWGVSEDGRTWTVTVREGAKFQDGTEITAEDVWWTWCHQWCPEAADYATQAGSQSAARLMEKIEQIGTNQVSLTTKESGGFSLTSLSAASAGAYDIKPKRPELHTDEAVNAYAKNPIGAGPMKLVKHVPASVMEFERFDDYYFQPDNGFSEDRRVKFSTLELFLVPEEATRVAAIRAKDADIAPASLAQRGALESDGARLVFGREGLYYRIMLMGCMDSQYPCFDKRVRHALDLAIDKISIRDDLMGGSEVMEVKGWASTTPSTIGYGPELDPWPQDADRARQLLADAGYPDGEGFGKLIVNTWVSTSMPFLPESAQLAASFWERELGLDVEVRVGDESALKKATLDPPTLYGQVLWRDNEARVDAGAGGAAYWLPGYKALLTEDPEIHAMVLAARQVTDPVEQEAAHNAVYRVLRDHSMELGIGYVNIPWAVSARIQSWKPFPLAFYPSGIHTIILEP